MRITQSELRILGRAGIVSCTSVSCPEDLHITGRDHQLFLSDGDVTVLLCEIKALTPKQFGVLDSIADARLSIWLEYELLGACDREEDV